VLVAWLQCHPSPSALSLLQAGRMQEAIQELGTAYQKQPSRCPLELYLQLGRCYLAQGQHECAKNVLLQAVAATPCASSWLALASALRKMGDTEGADLALTEANVLDPGNPLVWGHLALLAVKSARVQDAEQVCYSCQQSVAGGVWSAVLRSWQGSTALFGEKRHAASKNGNSLYMQNCCSP
jgi:Flp pilus assembly protein TadD